MIERARVFAAAALVVGATSLAVLAADATTARFEKLKALAVTVYTIDKGSLVLTHYCVEGNQPRMRAANGGDASGIQFKFDGGGNMKSAKDGHMHEATFAFTDADHVKSTWLYYKDGKPGENKEISLVRKKS
jgi:hypothetical protein